MRENGNRWFADYSNVLRLGEALVDAGFDAKQLQRYYEKPWKWTNEWMALMAGQESLEEVLNEVTKTIPSRISRR